MTTPPAGGQTLLPAASRPCRSAKAGCKRVARQDSPWCAWCLDYLLEKWHAPKWATA